MGIQAAMDRVTGAATIVEALRAADDLAFEAGRDPGVRTLRVLSAALAGTDDIAAIAAVHALSEMFDEQAAARLVSLLDDPRPFIHEHAAWALGQGLPRFSAIARLIALVGRGGFTGMLAQRTLEKWSVAAGDVLAVALESVLAVSTEATAAAGRARLVETLGLVRQSSATRTLLTIARTDTEAVEVREAAVAALGQRSGEPGVRRALEDLVTADGPLSDHARLAVIDLEPALAHPTRDTSSGLTVAQLFLHADIDPSLSAAGAGDNGGIATLLVRLGDALTHEPGAVERVLTLSRGSISQATADLLDVASQSRGHVYGHVPLAARPTPSAAAWPLRVRARRGIRRLLRAAGHIDVLHLRMADVGSLAAADVARELGIPTVFTLAPDPHAVIQSLDRAGTLTRENFGQTDLAEHFWFRTSLVRSLAGSASHSVLFPRQNLADDIRSLVGVDIDSVPERHTIVAEGVDLEVVDRSVALVSGGATDADPALRELADLVGALPPDRRDLPLIVSVGRMHRVKGMATLAETWAGSALSERANLLIIGGDLENPSLDEREQLDRIEVAVPSAERAARGLILAGHRPNDVAARWVAAARLGIPGRVAGRGVYVCASIKEEFGIALLEALATGLVVVAPDGGGPATYVADQDTGFLTATWDVHALAEATHRALDRAALADPAIAERARAMVAERFTIQAMAAALAPVYRQVAEQEAELVRAAGVA
ncbi:glycosyltransferase [Microbacterium sp.]|uniref:glycosyltransferase n=1 Tax=Microbacterium sp. TaxID=51671 RepID=UPI00260B4FB8|nr:glycosyltransferase [Microbacterium sp.]